MDTERNLDYSITKEYDDMMKMKERRRTSRAKEKKGTNIEQVKRKKSSKYRGTKNINNYYFGEYDEYDFE